jgi:hypothetical protein
MRAKKVASMINSNSKTWRWTRPKTENNQHKTQFGKTLGLTDLTLQLKDNNSLSPRNILHNQRQHLKSEGLKKICQAYGNWKQVGLGILISDKADFTQKSVRRDKEGHYIIKGTIQQEHITILSIHEPNISAPKFIKQILLSLKEQIGLFLLLLDNSGRS